MRHLTLKAMHVLPPGSMVVQDHGLNMSQFLIKKDSKLLGPSSGGIAYSFTFITFMKHPINDEEAAVDQIEVQLTDRGDGLCGMPECYFEPTQEEVAKFHAWFKAEVDRRDLLKAVISPREQRLEAIVRTLLPHADHLLMLHHGAPQDPLVNQQALATLASYVGEAKQLLGSIPEWLWDSNDDRDIDSGDAVDLVEALQRMHALADDREFDVDIHCDKTSHPQKPWRITAKEKGSDEYQYGGPQCANLVTALELFHEAFKDGPYKESAPPPQGCSQPSPT
jgi:hypothetical protein